jgi:hypothetical protein
MNKIYFEIEDLQNDYTKALDAAIHIVNVAISKNVFNINRLTIILKTKSIFPNIASYLIALEWNKNKYNIYDNPSFSFKIKMDSIQTYTTVNTNAVLYFGLDSDGIFEKEDKGSVALEIAIKEIADITLWGESYGVYNLIDKSKSFIQLQPSLKCQHALDAMNKSFNINGHRYHFGQGYIYSVKTYLRALNGLEPSAVDPRSIFAYARGKYNWSLS